MAHTVLLIDDSIPFHKLVKAYLEPDRTAIHSVYDGEAGIAAAEKFRTSLILLDVDIPCIDGFEVCRRLKANPATQSIPLIFLTADSMSGRAVSGLELGASDYISKPFKPQQFRARINATLRACDSLGAATLVDGLTGLWNRAYFDQHVNQYASLAARWGTELACIMIELDNYSALVASQGQEVAGGMVQTAARIFLGQSRTQDLVCRFGPAEFAILVTDAGRKGADHLVERIRGEIDRQIQANGSSESKLLTCSFGIADTQIADAGGLADRARSALDNAVGSGSNRVVVARATREKTLHS